MPEGQDNISRGEYNQRVQNATDQRIQEADNVSSHTIKLEGRISRLEEAVWGELGLIHTMKVVQSVVQDVRDALNRQAFVLPLITAVITAGTVAIVLKFIK